MFSQFWYTKDEQRMKSSQDLQMLQKFVANFEVQVSPNWEFALKSAVLTAAGCNQGVIESE